MRDLLEIQRMARVLNIGPGPLLALAREVAQNGNLKSVADMTTDQVDQLLGDLWMIEAIVMQTV